MTLRPPSQPAAAHPARGSLEIESSDDGHVIATFNPLLLAVFTRVPTEDELALIARRADDAIAAGIRGGVLYVVARQDMSGGVDPRVRATFERMIRANQGRSGASAVVVLTDGFAAAVVRAAIAGLLALYHRRGGMQVFGKVSDACAWLAREHELDPIALGRAFRRATAHLASLPRRELQVDET